MPAVKNGILRGRGLIRLGRGVPMVIAIVTKGLSQEMAAWEVELIRVRAEPREITEGWGI